MTISSTATKTSTAGNGSTTAFNFPYLFSADADPRTGFKYIIEIGPWYGV